MATQQNDDALNGANGSFVERLRERAHQVLEKAATPDDHLSRVTDIFLMSLIVLNLVAVSVETIEEIEVKYRTFFHAFDLFSLAVFTGEYIIRVWVCVVDPAYRDPVNGRIRYALTPTAIIDLLAVLPIYVGMLIPAFVLDLRAARVVRLFRLLRLLKVGRYSRSAQTLVNVMQLKKEELSIAIFAQLVLIAIASSLMYFVEHESQPEVFASVPHAMWWGVSTLTRVGYGDIYPITAFGKFLGSLISILGVAFFALPVGIIGSGFVQALHGEQELTYCPHCGERLPH